PDPAAAVRGEVGRGRSQDGDRLRCPDPARPGAGHRRVPDRRPRRRTTAMTAEQLPHLETFARAAELNCFTAAARALGLTQAAVSQRIQALEGVLGLALFQRRAGRVSLTPAGQRLYPFAERILGLHREAVEEVTGHKVPLSGELALAASSIP